MFHIYIPKINNDYQLALAQYLKQTSKKEIAEKKHTQKFKKLIPIVCYTIFNQTFKKEIDKKKVAQAQCQHHRRQEPNAKLIRAQKTNTKCRKRAVLTPIEHREILYFTRDFSLEADIERMDIECYCCGVLHFQKEWTARNLDQFTSCCHKGTANICKYNGVMAFASIVSNIQSPPGCRLYVYKILGQIYYFFGPVQPSTNDIPTFGQLYFMKTANAQIYRNKNSEVSPFAQAFQIMREVQHKENSTAIEQGRQLIKVQIIFENDCRLDQHHYNALCVNEVAANIISSGDCNFLSHYLAVHPCSDKGWHPNMLNS
ncbi:13620_t:CDS:2 [Cetraspora pellucida]|uniref:13620_t:CDS:1 n=1 Tax=Cetraspora pellucida TaxID=1433469 RepID=A0A9N9D9V2_9GLOM|nr:13620_t:CDS:2 [Cetraspora pellucida]